MDAPALPNVKSMKCVDEIRDERLASQPAMSFNADQELFVLPETTLPSALVPLASTLEIPIPKDALKSTAWKTPTAPRKSTVIDSPTLA